MGSNIPEYERLYAVNSISRRAFCSSVLTSMTALVVSRSLFAHEDQPRNMGLDLAKFERPSVLKAADQYLHEPPITITESSSPRSAGAKHDYFSEGDYWWPDPKNPEGPYIER